MSLTDERLDAAIRETLAESRTGPSDHPEPDVLLAYHEDELSEPEADAIREHLAECPECSQVILDFAAFPDLEPATEAHRATPAEMRRDWNGLQSRVADERSPWWRSHEYGVMPAAALFLVAVVGLGVWVWQLRESNAELRETVAELEAPDGSIHLTTLEPSSDSPIRGGGDVSVAHASAKGRVLLFLVVREVPYSPERLERFDQFTVDFRSSSGRTRMHGVPTRPQPEGGFVVDLPADFLEAGANTVELYGEGPDGRELIHEYLVTRDPDAESGWIDGSDPRPDRTDP